MCLFSCSFPRVVAWDCLKSASGKTLFPGWQSPSAWHLKCLVNTILHKIFCFLGKLSFLLAAIAMCCLFYLWMPQSRAEGAARASDSVSLFIVGRFCVFIWWSVGQAIPELFLNFLSLYFIKNVLYLHLYSKWAWLISKNQHGVVWVSCNQPRQKFNFTKDCYRFNLRECVPSVLWYTYSQYNLILVPNKFNL